MSMRNLTLMVSIFMLSTSAISIGAAKPQRAKITARQLSGKVVFERKGDLWIVNRDGTAQRKLMNHPAMTLLSSTEVSFSPDHQRIAFLGRDPKNRSYKSEELFLARFDGKYQRPLTHRDYSDHLAGPQFSPDGKTIVYTRWTGAHMGGPMSDDAENLGRQRRW